MKGLIVNADDFGLSDKVNEAICQCFKNGIISYTTAMANMPCIEKAIELSKKNGFIDKIGMHFNITEGKPLGKKILYCKRFCNDKGMFCYKRNSILFLSKKEKYAIIEEFEAQFSKLKQLGVNITHMDSHQHVHTEFAIYSAIKPSIKKTNIKTIRISRNLNIRSVVKPYKWIFNSILKIGGFKTTKYMGALKNDLSGMNINNTELMCHPLYENGKIIDSVLKHEIKPIKPYKLITFDDL